MGWVEVVELVLGIVVKWEVSLGRGKESVGEDCRFSVEDVGAGSFWEGEIGDKGLEDVLWEFGLYGREISSDKEIEVVLWRLGEELSSRWGEEEPWTVASAAEVYKLLLGRETE